MKGKTYWQIIFLIKFIHDDIPANKIGRLKLCYYEKKPYNSYQSFAHMITKLFLQETVNGVLSAKVVYIKRELPNKNSKSERI